MSKPATSPNAGVELTTGYARIRAANGDTHEVIFACSACHRRLIWSFENWKCPCGNAAFVIDNAVCVDDPETISTQSAEATLPCPACAAASFNQSGQFEYECPKCRIAWLVQQKGATSQSAEAEAREIVEAEFGTPQDSPIYQTAGRSIERLISAFAQALTRAATPTKGVEQALAELREMFPGRSVRITHQWNEGSETDPRGRFVEVCILADEDNDWSAFVGTLNEAMEKVREFAARERMDETDRSDAARGF